MQEGTGSSPLFANSATDLLRQLEEANDPDSRALEFEVRQLLQVFQSWAKARPSDEERVARINQLFDLHRRTLDFLAIHRERRTHPPSNRARP
ncbi:MAG: hypothetical protein HY898_14255 [Deltaproteobacteria bacterium]|nr:hypothetical protein [Deltaproteobacteria bacterium]